MIEQNTQIIVNLKEGSFTITGSEVFVEKHIEKLKTYIESNIKSIPLVSSTPAIRTECESDSDTSKTVSETPAFINKFIDNAVYYIDENGEVNILKKVPGKNKASKSRNIALILLYAKNDIVNSSEIKKHCLNESCYDQSNFSAMFKKKDNSFIRKGNGRNWSLQITKPGKAEAESLLEDMLNAK